ncbi:MAG: DUF4236 domain-containing protein [Rhodothermia bacterium]|nr:DUF4236 domain-containing protein [Rhodothermia bacterium]
MSWNYRKRIKIIPGVHLNFSKNGISTSIGFKGASLNFGKNGTYLNTSIPGTGLYNRQKLSGNNSNNQPENIEVQQPILEDNIFSADIQEITSQDLQGIKEAILGAHDQRQELNNDLFKIKSTLAKTKFKLAASYIFLYGIINKTIKESYKSDIVAQKDAIKQLQEQISNCYVNFEIEFDDEIKQKYEKVVSTFKQLISCHKIWDVTSANYQDTRVTRSAAGTVVQKREVRFGIKSLPDVKSTYEPLWFKNANGADLYFFPNFIIMYSTRTKFAVIGLEELEFYNSYTRFVETGTVPRDTKIIDKTWAKVNKNGTPDKRFKGNYQIPIVRYGEIKLRTKTGLNEEYEFSNYEFTEEFAKSFKDYQDTISRLNQINK